MECIHKPYTLNIIVELIINISNKLYVNNKNVINNNNYDVFKI